MILPRIQTLAAICSVALLAGCASEGRHLMPTPELYQTAGGPPVVELPDKARRAPDPNLDLLYITDRAVEDNPESDLPYGEGRGDRIAFGSATVRLVPPIDWDELQRQSRLAERTREIDLELGEVRETGTFPHEPYGIERLPSGYVIRDAADLNQHERAERGFRKELQRRLQAAPRKDVLLYIHGFNETFASAAYTAADLCHFLGREQVCAFFTWPASSSGNFLISYTNTTESADYAVSHLKKTIRMIADTPGVERVHLLAHSRGTAVTLNAAHDLVLESVAAGKEPNKRLKLHHLVLFSPDIDVDIATQKLTAFISDPNQITAWPERRLPRSINGRLTIYTSPNDRALLVSKLLFRSENRVGRLTAEDLSERAQEFLKRLGKTDIITYEGKRTDLFGHSYFTSNPQVSSDLVQLIRYGKSLGEPGRQLVETGSVTWEFPKEAGDDG